MKKVILITTLVFSLVFLLQGSSQAGQLYGALEPLAEKGHLAFSFGYFFSATDLEPTNDAFENIKPEQKQIFIQGGYGFIEKGEVYLRGGFADIEYRDFRDDYKPFGTLGIRLINPLNSIFSVGAFLQGSLYSNYSDEDTTTIQNTLIETKMETENLPWEVNLGVGLQAKINSVVLYAGPMGYWERVDIRERTIRTSLIDNSTVEEAISTRYEERDNIGGFFGLRWSLGEQVHIEVEGQMKKRISGGGSVTFTF